jgi:hypothetical protein
MKKNTAIIAAFLAVSAYITPISANAVYTIINGETDEFAQTIEGYTEIENCNLFDWAAYPKEFDSIYVNENGTEFLAFTKLDTINIIVELTDNIDTTTVENQLLDKYGTVYEDVHFHLERNFKTEQTSYYIRLESTPTAVTMRGAADMLEYLKDKGMISTGKLQNDNIQVKTFDVPAVNYYSVSYYDTEAKKYISNEERLKTYMDSELEGYSLEKVTASDGNMYFSLISPDKQTLAEQIKTAETIYDSTGINIPAISPESAFNISGTEIDVLRSIKGDANCDSCATVADAVAILQHIACRDKYELKPQGLFNADVDGIDGITANDARVLQQWDAGIR